MTERRGKLTVYLGAAPGVGKTFAALDEIRRRHDRGTDTVVGYVETHGRPNTVAQLEGLEVLPRVELSHRGTTIEELDHDGVLARRPDVVLVDELAHTNVPGSLNAKRAGDVADFLAAGIDVITTVNIQHLESLNNDVEQITGVRQQETVPDEVVRCADTIQLVDMSPDALRRRMAHGNVYKADSIDASLASYFRIGNLTALRELALLWLADRVDDALDDYRRDNQIEVPWPARERVVVAVTGGPESESLLRRAARIAQRSAGSELLAVHVIATDGLRSGPDDGIARLRLLTESLAGTFHTVVGDDVPRAVVDFAAGVNGSMIVVGVSRRHRLRRLFVESTAQRLARVAGTIDVHLVTHDEAASGWPEHRYGAPLSRRRVLGGFLLALVLPAALTGLLSINGAPDPLTTGVAAYLAVTVLVALLGGLWPALLSALLGFLQLNWFFTPPVGRFTIASRDNLIALSIFVLVAVAVASVVDLASRRAVAAARAGAESAALSELSRSVLSENDTAEAITDRLRTTFSLQSVALLEKVSSAGQGSGWTSVASSGNDPPMTPTDADTIVGIDDDRMLAFRGPALPASDRRVLDAFAAQTGMVLEYRRLREQEARARVLEKVDETRTAVLRAVSHDLRTPLATIRAAVDNLSAADVELPPDDVRSLVDAIDSATADLTTLIENLLDLSRLQSGRFAPAMRSVSLGEVVAPVLAGLGDAVRLELSKSVPLVLTDPGLLQRVVANIVGNAVRHSPVGEHVLVVASVDRNRLELRVVDRGPGVRGELRDRLFEPFQRLGDTSPEGLGLGLAVAHGLADALDVGIGVDDTPGGGLTMTLSIPLAQPAD